MFRQCRIRDDDFAIAPTRQQDFFGFGRELLVVTGVGGKKSLGLDGELRVVLRMEASSH